MSIWTAFSLLAILGLVWVAARDLRRLDPFGSNKLALHSVERYRYPEKLHW